MRLHPARDRPCVDRDVLPFMRRIAKERYPHLAFDEVRARTWLFSFHTPDDRAELHWFAPDVLIALRKERFSVTCTTIWRASVFATETTEVTGILSGIMKDRDAPICLLCERETGGVFLGHQYLLSASDTCAEPA